jgi:DNA-binding CsgD family transcriptional regulator
VRYLGAPYCATTEVTEAALSERELEVLSLMAEGCTDAEIGERLLLAPFAIKSHTTNLFAKLGASNRAHAVALGFKRRLLE